MPSNDKTWVGLLLPTYAAVLLVIILLASHTAQPPSPEALSPPPPSPPTPDFAAIADIPERKQAFFDYFRPLIAWQNERLLHYRAQLQALETQLEDGRSLSRQQLQLLRQWAEEFDVTAAGPKAKVEALLPRINIIPEALALAQAAAESAWGTSRFATDANNYFGQWCFRAGCGLVPHRRTAGARHEVAKFESPEAAVAAYFHNLNTFHSYENFRLIRQTLAEQGSPITAMALANGLTSYSERGEDYIEELRVIIRVNDLE